MKTCTLCGSALPATTEHWQRQARARDGLSYRCKPCLQEYDRARWAAADEETRQHRRDYFDGVYYPANRETVIRRVMETRRRRVAHPSDAPEFQR